MVAQVAGQATKGSGGGNNLISLNDEGSGAYVTQTNRSIKTVPVLFTIILFLISSITLVVGLRSIRKTYK